MPSSMQTLLIALIPIAFIGWRLRRLVGVLRGGGSSGKKIFFSLIIVAGLIARISSMLGTPKASA